MNGLRVGLALAGTVAVGLGLFRFDNSGVAAASAMRSGSSLGGKIGTDPGSIKEGGMKPAKGDEVACFSGGCFWGVEEHFRQVPGVVATAVGYTGGTVPNPSYELVCTHTTGHAESVLIEFNPKKISYRQLVDSFWTVTNPTEMDRQGPDVGSNYRSAIWTYSDAQKAEALQSIKARQSKENGPIVTKVLPARPFYLAEDYHQQYDEKSGTLSCPSRE